MLGSSALRKSMDGIGAFAASFIIMMGLKSKKGIAMRRFSGIMSVTLVGECG